MLHHDDRVGLYISISYGLDDPNSAEIVAFILVKLHSLQSLSLTKRKYIWALKHTLWLQCVCFPESC